MKKLLLVLLAVVTTIGTLIAAPEPKMKKIKLADAVVYNGFVLQKLPLGEGSITMSTCGNITGTFNGNEITNGKIEFENHKFVITGDMTYSVAKNGVGASGYTDLTGNFSYFAYSKSLLVTVKNAKINNRSIVGDVRFVYCFYDYALDYHSVGYPKVSKDLVETIKLFVGEEKFQRTANGKIYNIVVNSKVNHKVVKEATELTLTFKNGAVAVIDVEKGVCKMTRTNGDFITINGGAVESYRISAGKSIIANGQITHTFENGNKYVGTVDETLEPYTKVKNINALLSFNGLNWSWTDFKKHADDGEIVYADGKSDKIVNGITETERKAKVEALKALRANDKVVYASDGEIASCTITYPDGVVFKYEKKDGEVVTHEYVYKNGNKMGAYFDCALTKEIYNELIADPEAPKISDWNYRASYRHFANGYKITDYDKYLMTPKQKNGDYITYVWQDDQFVPEYWQKTINGDVYYCQLFVNTQGGEEQLGCVKYANKKISFGKFAGYYTKNPNNSVKKDANIAALGVNVVCGLEDIVVPEYEVGFLCSQGGDYGEKLEAMYVEGRQLRYSDLVAAGNYQEAQKMALVLKVMIAYSRLLEKYDADYDYVKAYFDTGIFQDGTPIAFVREITNQYTSKGSAITRKESVSGSIRKIVVSDSDSGCDYTFEFNAKTNRLVSFTQSQYSGSLFRKFHVIYSLYAGDYL